MSVSIYCPQCLRFTSLTLAKSIDDEACGCMYLGYSGIRWWIGICNNCFYPVLVAEKGMWIYPSPQPIPTDERIPGHIRKDLDESKSCFSISAYRGCAVQARRALQVACIDNGATSNDLTQQINDLYQNGEITRHLKEWAHVVRWVGNDAAHPNQNEVEKEDAEDILDLAEQFLHTMYVAPSIASSRSQEIGR